MALTVRSVRSLAQICDDPVVAAAGPPPAWDKSRPPPLTIDHLQTTGSNANTRNLLPNGFYKFVVSNPKDVELLLLHNRCVRALWPWVFCVLCILIVFAFAGVDRVPLLLGPWVSLASCFF